MGLPRLTSLLVVVGIGILSRTLGLGVVGTSEVGSLDSVTAGVGLVVTGSKLVASGVGGAGTSWVRFSVGDSSLDSGSTIAVGRRLQSGL